MVAMFVLGCFITKKVFPPTPVITSVASSEKHFFFRVDYQNFLIQLAFKSTVDYKLSCAEPVTRCFRIII